MNKVKCLSVGLGLLVLSTLFTACNKSASGSIVSTGTVSITSVVQSKFLSTVTISTSGSGSNSSITIKSNGLPEHKTPYWGLGNALYEPFP